MATVSTSWNGDEKVLTGSVLRDGKAAVSRDLPPAIMQWNGGASHDGDHLALRHVWLRGSVRYVRNEEDSWWLRLIIEFG